MLTVLRFGAPATITRRLCTVAGFYRYAVEEELLDHSSPGARLKRVRHRPNLQAAGAGPP